MITIWSGGQTGVDRGALDAALSLGVPIGGWAPKGWRAEDGVIPERYRVHMREHPSADYRPRTVVNVDKTDATLILHRGKLTPGTRLTWQIAGQLNKPRRMVDVGNLHDGSAEQVAVWLYARGVRKLNVAGQRESKCPGIQAVTEGFMVAVLERLIEAEKGQSK